MSQSLHSIPTALLQLLPQSLLHQEPQFLGNAGGFSGAALWRFSDAVVRRWPVGVPLARVLEIHSAMSRLREAGISFVAPAWRLGDGTTAWHDGTSVWQIGSWLPGRADFHAHPSTTRLTNAMQAVGKIHVTWCRTLDQAKRGVPRSITTRCRMTKELLGGQLQRLQATLEPHASELAETSKAVLNLTARFLPRLQHELDAAAHIEVPRQCCLRDIWHDHVLFEGDRISGIVDFDAVGLDTIAADLARLLGSLIGFDPIRTRTALDAYRRCASLDEAEVHLFEVIRRANAVLSPIPWVRWLFVERRIFEDPPRVLRRLRLIEAELREYVTATSGAPE